MTKKPHVLLIGTLDTKEIETKFIRGILEEQGLAVHHLDASIRAVVDGGAAITPEQIAKAAGTTIAAVRALGHEGKCQAVMIEGSIKCALDLHQRVGLSGIIAIGGSMGTTPSSRNSLSNSGRFSLECSGPYHQNQSLPSAISSSS